MPFILYDDPTVRLRLLPFTHTRPVADIRCGALTLRERWELCFGGRSDTLTAPHLQALFPSRQSGKECLIVNSSVLGTPGLAEELSALQLGEALMTGELVIGARLSTLPALTAIEERVPLDCRKKLYAGPVTRLATVWDIFSLAGQAISDDFAMLTKGRNSAPAPAGVTVRQEEAVFFEDGAIIGAGTVINAASGPVYVGKGAEVMEGCLLRGPLFIGEGAVIKMGAKIYGGTSIGPGCKVGGEVQNVVFFANSNKGHDGYLGNAVIGEWCNIGADTNASNLKNNYDEVKIWDEAANRSVKTGLTFCGLLMGDHSKCGINTMFNTGTVVGVSCNLWGAGFPRPFIPSFTWGSPEGHSTYQIGRALDTARRVLVRRGRELSDAEAAVLHHVFEATASLRRA